MKGLLVGSLSSQNRHNDPFCWCCTNLRKKNCLWFKGNSDIVVDCGDATITLEINLCTAQWSGFNATDLALNGKHNITDCLGTIDSSADPPVIRYQLPVNHSQENPCRQSLQVRCGLVLNCSLLKENKKEIMGFCFFLHWFPSFLPSCLDCRWDSWSFWSLQQLFNYPVSDYHRLCRHTQNWPGPHQLLHGPVLSLLLPLPARVPH